MNEIDQSLKKLGTDYVDLYYIHRSDYGTPLEERIGHGGLPSIEGKEKAEQMSALFDDIKMI